jgi:outer membrane protein
LPNYPAAEENTVRVFAAPVPIYRRKILRLGGEENRGAVSGRFINRERFQFDVSLSAAFPVDSGDNDARRDMPDLDFLFGIVPRLKLRLINEPDHTKLDLNLPPRAVYSTDFLSVDSQGYVFDPTLSYTRENSTDLELKVFASAESVFATEDLMDYFYEVASNLLRPRARPMMPMPVISVRMLHLACQSGSTSTFDCLLAPGSVSTPVPPTTTAPCSRTS